MQSEEVGAVEGKLNNQVKSKFLNFEFGATWSSFVNEGFRNNGSKNTQPVGSNRGESKPVQTEDRIREDEGVKADDLIKRVLASQATANGYGGNENRKRRASLIPFVSRP
ncbi:hypothetical protein E3N88_22617 [Mikania micrantha]|uniref:Uncharacterized protein n=1 Tax=Mikania micrantha TaxID=192012 RepID=A0A5N6NAW5_9ASTR|nr:hypothetical protein E3N88_22617 [Mikania micrantha]